MLPSEPSNFCRNHLHFEVSMEVGVPDVPRCIDYVPENFVLKFLYYGNFARFYASPQLYVIGSQRSSSGESGNMHVTAAVFSSALRHSLSR